MMPYWIFVLLQIFVTAGAFECPSPGLHSHPTDCTQFCNCGSKKLQCPQFQSCPKGLHFDNTIKTCVWIHQSTCKSPKTSTRFPKKIGSTRKTVNQKTFKPSTRKPSTQKEEEFKIVCYFTNWANYRTELIAKFEPENIDHELCTHILYGFATLNDKSLKIQVHDDWFDIQLNGYKRVTDLKKYGKKVFLAIGGWNDSEGDKYSRLVRRKETRKAFIDDVVKFLKKHNFDGLELDWEYPACSQGKCDDDKLSDKENFVLFVKELKKKMFLEDLHVSAAIAANPAVARKAYNVTELSEHLDFMSLMAYDYHGYWEDVTGHHTQFRGLPGDINPEFNAVSSIQYYLENGADPKKIVVGVGAYGKSFTLSNNAKNGLNAPAKGGGRAGKHTKMIGTLAFYEICENLKSKGWTKVPGNESVGPYAFHEDQWVGYSDVRSTAMLAKYIKSKGLGGALIWTLDFDDFTKSCCQTKSPLITTVKSVLTGKGPSVEQIASSCPQGKSKTTSAVQSNNQYRRVCRYSNSNNAKYTTEQLKDETSCTHIIYTYAKLNEEYHIQYSDKWQDIDLGGYKTVTDLKSTEKKVLLSIGALDDSEGRKFSLLVADQTRIQNFIKHAIKFLKDHNFDGLDIDWRYPACSPSICYAGTAIEKIAFATFVKEVRCEFDKQTPRLLLTAVLSGKSKVFYASQSKVHIRTLSENLDFINLMTYGYHGTWEKRTGHYSPLYSQRDDMDDRQNIAASVQYFLNAGADKRKIVVGISTLGNAFKLSRSYNHGLKARTAGAGEAGEISKMEGYLAYSEICDRVKYGEWTKVYEDITVGPYVYSGNRWASYLDVEAVKRIAKYVMNEKLGGAYISNLEYDDFKGDCYGIKSSLLNTVDAIFSEHK